MRLTIWLTVPGAMRPSNVGNSSRNAQSARDSMNGMMRMGLLRAAVNSSSCAVGEHCMGAHGAHPVLHGKKSSPHDDMTATLKPTSTI